MLNVFLYFLAQIFRPKSKVLIIASVRFGNSEYYGSGFIINTKLKNNTYRHWKKFEIEIKILSIKFHHFP